MHKIVIPENLIHDLGIQNSDDNLSENSPPINTAKSSSPQDIIIKETTQSSMKSASMSDLQHINKDMDTFSMSPLYVAPRTPTSPSIRRRKRRSHSNSESGRLTPYKYEMLKKKCKSQESQLQMYQDKITNIQDTAEETEHDMKRRYELKLLHLETKYLREKSEKASLQNEVEKLKQEIYVNNAHIHATPPHINRYTSSSTVIVHADTTPIGKTYDHTPIGRSPFDIMNTHSPVSVDSFTAEMGKVKRANTRSTIRTSFSQSASSTSAESSDSESDSSTETESDSTSSDSTEYYNSSEEEFIIKSKHNRKEIKKLNESIQQQQPKGFWEKIWSLFGPPDLVCGCK